MYNDSQDCKITAPMIAQQGCYLEFRIDPKKLFLHSVRIKEIETGLEVLAFTIDNSISLTQPLEMSIDVRKLGALANYGFPIISVNAKSLAELYREFYHSIPVLFCYDTIGWQSDAGGKLYFHGSDLIYFGEKTAYEIDALVNDGLIPPRKSERLRELVIPHGFDGGNASSHTLSDSSSHLKKAGSLPDSIEFFNEVISDRIMTQIIIATGFSSILVGLLKHSSPILNICGKSSIGKSLLSQLATSIYSVKDENKITATFDATPKALETLLHNNTGVLVVIDDTSTGYDKEHDLGRLIYNLSKGVNRKRLGKDNKINSSLKWYTSIITSSEKSIFANHEKGKFGELRRCIELEPVKSDLIKDAQMAERIRKFSTNNYGLLGVAFINKMLEGGLTVEEVQRRFDAEADHLQSSSLEDGIYKGFTETAAHITLAAQLAKELLNLDFDVVGMQEKFLDIIEQMVEKFNGTGPTPTPSYSLQEAYRELCRLDNILKHNEPDDKFIGVPIKELNLEALILSNMKDELEVSATKDELVLTYIHIPVRTFNDFAVKFGYTPKQLKTYLNEHDLTQTNPGRSEHTIKGGKHISILILKNDEW